jgi:flagellar motor switch protein FliM
MFMGEKFGRDSVWESYLGREVRSTEVLLEAVLNEKTLRLGDVFNFKVGSTVLFDASPDDDVTIKCSGIPMLKGELGQIENSIAVKIKQRITPADGEAP